MPCVARAHKSQVPAGEMGGYGPRDQRDCEDDAEGQRRGRAPGLHAQAISGPPYMTLFFEVDGGLGEILLLRRQGDPEGATPYTHRTSGAQTPLHLPNGTQGRLDQTPAPAPGHVSSSAALALPSVAGAGSDFEFL